MTETTPRPTRRKLLAGAAIATTGSTGCLRRISNVAGRDQASQVTLDIRTTPADSDPHGIRIARHLANNLEAAGVAARVTTMSEAELYRSVLINHDFDIYVGQYPNDDPPVPDGLYPLLHSDFRSESGWQNPFGFTNLTIDDLLLDQRSQTGGKRRQTVVELQEAIAREQPFVSVAFPDALTAVQESRFQNWGVIQPTSAKGLLKLEHVPTAEQSALRLVTTDGRITENRNPIAAEFRRNGAFTELLYDPLARKDGGELIPWLAREWEWKGGSTLDIRLRDANWHDGEPVTAADVAFTYAFLGDTSMGEAESPIPTSRFRGRSTLVSNAAALDEETARLRFTKSSREVALRALTVPILPEHVWSDRTGPATIAGIEVDEETTEALVWNNPEPVGSGPLRFADATAEEQVAFDRTEDHFLANDPAGIPEAFHGKPAFDRLEIEVVPSDIAAVQRISDQLADATAANLGSDAVPRIGREATARLVSSRSGAFYHVGFNARRGHLSNPRFRRTVASFIDKQWLVDETFQGYATGAASPLETTRWIASNLQWDGTDPETPFFGEDGELDVSEARDAFREIGYRYNEDGELVATEQ